jgi:uncharacterized protein involved in exopolysaccharide biosynthesis
MDKQPMTDECQTYPMYADDEIDLRELFGILWAEKWLIIGITAVAAVISVVVSLLMTEIYRAEVTLAPADTEQTGGGLAAQLGGAAALLGVNVGRNGGDNTRTALAILTSRDFIGRFIDENELLVPLFAGKWNKSRQESEIDTDIYNPTTGEWTRKKGQPNRLEAYREFREILSVLGPDRDSGIVTIAINWHNPIEASDWANAMVAALNRELRARDVEEASSAIDYLRRQLEATQLVDMQRVFYQLIESQTRITMLADVRNEYVFRVIDPAVVPDQKFSPKRSLIATVGTMAGGMLALMVVFLRRLFRQD